MTTPSTSITSFFSTGASGSLVPQPLRWYLFASALKGSRGPL